MSKYNKTFGTVENAFESLVKQKPIFVQKGFVCKQGVFVFKYYNTWKKWTWAMEACYDTSNPLTKLFNNISNFQQEGFQSRKDVISYVDSIAGKNSEFGLDFSSLQKISKNYYLLNGSRFRLFKNIQRTWVIDNFFEGSCCTQDQNGKAFQTRKQALAYLFDTNQLS